MRLSIVIACAAIMTHQNADAQNSTDKRMIALIQRPAESLVPLIAVTGDSLDPTVTISTHGVTAFVSKGLLGSATTENSFLRAFIDKKTGNVTAQVCHSLSYGGRGFDTHRRASYETPNGIAESDVDTIATDVSCGRYGCTHYEDLVFPIDLKILRKAAAAYDPTNPMLGIKYRLFGQSGNNVDDGIPINEIVAFITVIDRQSSSVRP